MDSQTLLRPSQKAISSRAPRARSWDDIEASIHEQVMRRGPNAIKVYNECILNDQDVEWAAMCALQQPPGTRYTDKAYQQAARADMNSMPTKLREAIVQTAREAGINTTGKHFEGSLGGYTDPMAWVSDLSDVSAAAKAKNMDMDGAVKIRGNIRHQSGDDARRPTLSPKLTAEAVNAMMKEDPGLREKVRKKPKLLRELKDKAVEMHAS